ncbi:hypothetical protein PIB30_009755 [Stylosanthes scabra]|uniref:Uncharacterized protein n=1 Tax=Stylosanthes scabra TaxID=79078 RepID=A0ABU6X362_9FABA|nr:hypothetical protein [Stylosanthes scabra]
MEAFYASVKAETTQLSNLREPPRTRPSQKTLKAWQLLQDLSVDECLSKAEKAKKGLNANVREFKETVTDENALCIKLECLVRKKRELEEEIKQTNAKIARLMSKRDTAAKGKVLRSKRDGLMNRVPRLKAERDLAFLTETNIEGEWSRLGKQLLQNTSFAEDWM